MRESPVRRAKKPCYLCDQLTRSLTIKRISKQLALQYFWVSYLTHLSNVHWWEDGYKMTGCEHADLPQDDQTLWLVKDSNEYVLEKIMTDKQFVRKLRHFVHTSALESFHNVILKYTPKNLFFLWQA